MFLFDIIQLLEGIYHIYTTECRLKLFLQFYLNIKLLVFFQ